MEYNEEKAKEIISQHGLSPKTDKVWKTRGKIPDKYAREGFEMRKPLSRAEIEKQDYLKKIIRSEKINTEYWGESAGLPRILIFDVGRDRQNMSQQELLKVVKALQKFRIQVKEVIELCQGKNVYGKAQNEALLKLLRSDWFHYTNLLEFDVTDYGRVMHWRQGKMDNIPDNLKARVIDRLAIFLLETSV